MHFSSEKVILPPQKFFFAPLKLPPQKFRSGYVPGFKEYFYNIAIFNLMTKKLIKAASHDKMEELV